MQKVPFKIIAVFVDKKKGCKGNTSSVVMLSHQLDESKMQAIAADFNQPATTFMWPADEENHFHVRWFAPDGQIGLCGHGSVAALAYLGMERAILHYKDGSLEGSYKNDEVKLEMEGIASQSSSFDPEIGKGLGVDVKEYHENNNKHIVVVENEAAVNTMIPDFVKLSKLKPFGYIVTAQGTSDYDFVSRTIVPKVQQLEDPATGSSHACLTPFWSERLNKKNMIARQLSKRGGYFKCTYQNSKVTLTSKADVFSEGHLFLS